MVDCRILNYLKIHRPVFSDKRAILRNKRCVFYVLTERITGVTIERRNKIMHDKKIQNLTTPIRVALWRAFACTGRFTTVCA